MQHNGRVKKLFQHPFRDEQPKATILLSKVKITFCKMGKEKVDSVPMKTLQCPQNLDTFRSPFLIWVGLSNENIKESYKNMML